MIGDVNNPTIEVGVKSGDGSNIIFVDFRFNPYDSETNSYVYNYQTGTMDYVLGGDNTFTQYEYDDRGPVIRINQESIKYGLKKVKEFNNNYKRLNN